MAGSVQATLTVIDRRANRRDASLTTALMVSARNDAAVEALPATATHEERALVFAKAIARRAVSEWGGVGPSPP